MVKPPTKNDRKFQYVNVYCISYLIDEQVTVITCYNKCINLANFYYANLRLLFNEHFTFIHYGETEISFGAKILSLSMYIEPKKYIVFIF